MRTPVQGDAPGPRLASGSRMAIRAPGRNTASWHVFDLRNDVGLSRTARRRPSCSQVCPGLAQLLSGTTHASDESEESGHRPCQAAGGGMQADGPSPGCSELSGPDLALSGDRAGRGCSTGGLSSPSCTTTAPWSPQAASPGAPRAAPGRSHLVSWPVAVRSRCSYPPPSFRLDGVFSPCRSGIGKNLQQTLNRNVEHRHGPGMCAVRDGPGADAPWGTDPDACTALCCSVPT